MPSIIPGYEYDIFISYRQKDNRSDQWVTNFVQALKEELDATFKEDISIYFDENPHDGLHEHHEVDDSLREKLKGFINIYQKSTLIEKHKYQLSRAVLPLRNLLVPITDLSKGEAEKIKSISQSLLVLKKGLIKSRVSRWFEMGSGTYLHLHFCTKDATFDFNFKQQSAIPGER